MTSSPRSDAPSPGALEVLKSHGFVVSRTVALAGDVSSRRYFRVDLEPQGTAILAVYPPQIRSSCGRFVRTTELLDTAGVRCPGILGAFCEDGLMLLEDLGNQTLYELRGEPWSSLKPWLRRAANLLPAFASLPTGTIGSLNPPLDKALLSAEIERTWDLLLGAEGALPGALPEGLATAFDDLIERLAAAPTSPCHRDFMARNLVPVGTSDLAVIDHQDLRIGPRAYDLASLLNDSLFPPVHLEMEIARGALDAAELPDYHRAAAQRTLKAVGTFLGFSQRGDDRHLVLVAPTLERARRHLEQLPEMAASRRTIEGLWTELLAVLASPGADQRIC